MKPQNKVTIFMIVMIVMLSIYYFALPDKTPGDKNDNTPPVVKSEEFTELRNNLKETRQAMITDLYSYIGTDVSPDQVKVALNTIQELNNLSQNESMLEAELLLAGYFDVFVESNTTEVKVYVYTDQLTTSEAISIIDKTKTRFGTDVNVIIKSGYDVN